MIYVYDTSLVWSLSFRHAVESINIKFYNYNQVYKKNKIKLKLLNALKSRYKSVLYKIQNVLHFVFYRT